MGKYDDIINLEHFEPKNHKRMSTYQRAAQFSPFAALTGYDDLVKETTRITHDKIELSEYEKSLVNDKLIKIKNNIKSSPDVSITYFSKDKVKKGGLYNTIYGYVKSIDMVNRFIKLSNNSIIYIDDIYNIEIS